VIVDAVCKEAPLSQAPVAMTIPNRQRLILGGLLLLAIGVRVLMVLLDHHHQPGGDEPIFIQIAGDIVHGRGVSYFDSRFPRLWSPGMPTASRAPGASFWLAFWFWLGGESLVVPRIVVAIASGAMTYLFFRIGRIFHSYRAGIISALLWLFSISAVFSWYGTASVIAEPLALVFLIIAFYSAFTGLAAGALRNAVVCGACLGAASLLRPTALTVLVFVAIWALVFSRSKKTAQFIAVAALAQALMIGPWAIRNFIELRTLSPISTYAATNFYASNNPLCTANRGALNQQSFPFEPDAIADMQRLPEAEVERYCWRRGFSYLLNNPKVVPYLLWRRTILFFDPSIQLAAPLPSFRLFDLSYILALLLATIGALRYRRHPITWLCLLWSINFVWINIILISGHPRYRQLIDPQMIGLAGAGGAVLLERASRTLAPLFTRFRGDPARYAINEQ
jgi:4-amino-4-deoxy-L-arabinose transferase-like glycosyltransferase